MRELNDINQRQAIEDFNFFYVHDSSEFHNKVMRVYAEYNRYLRTTWGKMHIVRGGKYGERVNDLTSINNALNTNNDHLLKSVCEKISTKDRLLVLGRNELIVKITIILQKVANELISTSLREELDHYVDTMKVMEREGDVQRLADERDKMRDRGSRYLSQLTAAREANARLEAQLNRAQIKERVLSLVGNEKSNGITIRGRMGEDRTTIQRLKEELDTRTIIIHRLVKERNGLNERVAIIQEECKQIREDKHRQGVIFSRKIEKLENMVGKLMRRAGMNQDDEVDTSINSTERPLAVPTRIPPRRSSSMSDGLFFEPSSRSNGDSDDDIVVQRQCDR